MKGRPTRIGPGLAAFWPRSRFFQEPDSSKHFAEWYCNLSPYVRRTRCPGCHEGTRERESSRSGRRCRRGHGRFRAHTSFWWARFARDVDPGSPLSRRFRTWLLGFGMARNLGLRYGFALRFTLLPVRECVMRDAFTPGECSYATGDARSAWVRAPGVGTRARRRRARGIRGSSREHGLDGIQCLMKKCWQSNALQLSARDNKRTENGRT